jgi:glycosyltransferase involved in cell wall biosynthesis
LRNPLFLYEVLNKVRQYRPDLIHFLSEKNTWLNILMPFLRGTPVVTTVHDVDYHPGDTGFRNVPQWCTRLFIQQSSAIVVHGQILHQQAIRKFHMSERNTYVIPHPALPFYRDLAVSENLEPLGGSAPIVLFFGRIRRYKGIDTLISAAARVASELTDVQFVIAGQTDSQTRPILANAIGSIYDIRDRFIPDIEAAQLFLNARLIVLPYAEGSQSGVLAIANTFGLPVVATNIGEIGKTVIESCAGLVVPPNNAEALANAILALLQDQGLSALLGQNARNHADSQCGPLNIGTLAVRTYEKVINCYYETYESPHS